MRRRNAVVVVFVVSIIFASLWPIVLACTREDIVGTVVSSMILEDSMMMESTTVSSSGAKASSQISRLTAAGKYVKDEFGNVVCLRGVNHAGFTDDPAGWWTHGNTWEPDEIRRHARDMNEIWGMNVVRFHTTVSWWIDDAVTWQGVSYPSYRQNIRDAIEICWEEGLYVVFEGYNVLPLEAQVPCPFPPYSLSGDEAYIPSEQAYIDWCVDVVTELSVFPNFIFEIWNEPVDGGHGDPATYAWWRVAGEVIDAVRALPEPAGSTPIIWHYGYCGGFVDRYWFDDPDFYGHVRSKTNLIISNHYYRFHGSCAGRGDTVEGIRGCLIDYNYLRIGDEWNVPVWVGETGAVHNDVDEQEHFRNLLHVMNEFEMGYAAFWWRPDGVFQLYDNRQDRNPNLVGQMLINAITETAPEIVSVAHDPNIQSYPDKSESPYGPDVNPVYGLVEQALVYLNPGNPENPLSNIIQQGDTVVLKPNLVGTSAFATEGCTRTPVLRPLVDFAVEAGASKVIIAEGSALPYSDSRVFGPDYSNITGLVEALQNMYPDVVITYEDLNLDNFTWVDLGEHSAFYEVYTPEQLYSKTNIRMDENSYYYAEDCNGYNPKGYRPGLYAIANTVFQANVFINIPKMKVHMITGVTLALKNLIGITVSSTGNTTNEETIKDIPHWNNSEAAHAYEEVLTRQDSFAHDVIWRVMADLNKIVLYADENTVLLPVKQRNCLSVVDAVIGMEGPTMYDPPGVPRPTGAIVAGQDPVAVDAVCSRVMGYNYTVLNSVVNIEQISNHPIGDADPTVTCVVGTSLNSSLFGESYMPHLNYEDPQIAPHKIRLQYFDPPTAEFIQMSPATPEEGVEIKVIVTTQNVNLVAAGWLRYSLDSAEPILMKMVPNEETLIGNLGLLDAGTNISYDVCLQDPFFNTCWSDKSSVIVVTEFPVMLLLSLFIGAALIAAILQKLAFRKPRRAHASEE